MHKTSGAVDREATKKLGALCAAVSSLWLAYPCVPVNAEIESSDTIQQILDAAHPSFVCTTNKLGAGVDSKWIGITTVLPTRYRQGVSAKDQYQWLARGFRGQQLSLLQDSHQPSGFGSGGSIFSSVLFEGCMCAPRTAKVIRRGFPASMIAAPAFRTSAPTVFGMF